MQMISRLLVALVLSSVHAEASHDAEIAQLEAQIDASLGWTKGGFCAMARLQSLSADGASLLDLTAACESTRADLGTPLAKLLEIYGVDTAKPTKDARDDMPAV